MVDNSSSNSAACGIHGEQLHFICTACGQFVCDICVIDHNRDNHGAKYLQLLTYAEKLLVPKYDSAIRAAEEKIKTSEKWFREYVGAAPRMLERLGDFKKRLDKFVSILAHEQKTLQQSACIPPGQLFAAQISAIRRPRAELREAIASRDIRTIVRLAREIKTPGVQNVLDFSDVQSAEELTRMLDPAGCLIPFRGMLERLFDYTARLQRITKNLREDIKIVPLEWTNETGKFWLGTNGVHYTMSSAPPAMKGAASVMLKVRSIKDPGNVLVGFSTQSFRNEKMEGMVSDVAGKWRAYGFCGSGYFKESRKMWNKNGPTFKTGDILTLGVDAMKNVSLQVNRDPPFVGFFGADLNEYYLTATLYFAGDSLEIINCRVSV